MDTSLASNTLTSALNVQRLAEQKRRIRALKRVLVAKAEVRRLKALVGHRRVAKV